MRSQGFDQAWRIARRWLALLLLVAMALVVFLSESALRPARWNAAPDPAAWQPVQIEGARSDRLSAAWREPPGASRCVLMLHGVGDNHASSLSLGETFAASGYKVLAPDSRAHGASGGGLATFGLLEREDLRRWSYWTLARGCPGGLFAYGASMGAGVLLQAMAAGAPILAGVAEAPFASFRRVGADRISQQLQLPLPLARLFVATSFIYVRLRFGLDLDQADPIALAPRILAPVLLVHGRQDRNIPPGHSVSLHAALPQSELWLVDGAGHIDAHRVTGPEYSRRLLAFFDDARLRASARTERAYGNPQTRQ